MTRDREDEDAPGFASPPCSMHEADPAYMGFPHASGAAPGGTEAAAWGTDELIDHILRRYHETHRRQLPELIALAEKVEAVHGGHARAPRGLARLLQQMQGELEVHMKKEELILFPAMRRGPRAALDAPIAQMRHDHDGHGALLREMARLTGEFTAPGDACRSWQALCTGTAALAADLAEHIRLENEVLFPRYQGAQPG